MWIVNKRNRGRRLSLLLALASIASYGLPRAKAAELGQPGLPILTVSLPSKNGVSQYYYVQPLTIALTNAGNSDGLATLRVDVVTNPQHHQRVLTAKFSPAFRVMSVRTRVRLAGRGHALVEVEAKTRAGKKLTAMGQIQLRKGVDFSDVHSLTKRLPPNIVGLKGPVGTARARLSVQKGLARQFSAIIQHPMLPAIGGQSANRLVSIDIPYRSTRLAQMQLGDAISNDPYVDIQFIDSEPGVGPVGVLWRDEVGRVYRPGDISIKR